LDESSVTDKGVSKGTPVSSLDLAVKYRSEFDVRERLDVREIKSPGGGIKTSFPSEDPNHALYNSPN
jgi:hypothetical protein